MNCSPESPAAQHADQWHSLLAVLGLLAAEMGRHVERQGILDACRQSEPRAQPVEVMYSVHPLPAGPAVEGVQCLRRAMSTDQISLGTRRPIQFCGLFGLRCRHAVWTHDRRGSGGKHHAHRRCSGRASRSERILHASALSGHTRRHFALLDNLQ
ncbi:hypothetical protein BD413DRAFT_557836 [Trametes elegans]|nr:hypothetical protein BD413DRAFT_557836 [Trametes elegans]